MCAWSATYPQRPTSIYSVGVPCKRLHTCLKLRADAWGYNQRRMAASFSDWGHATWLFMPTPRTGFTFEVALAIQQFVLAICGCARTRSRMCCLLLQITASILVLHLAVRFSERLLHPARLESNPNPNRPYHPSAEVTCARPRNCGGVVWHAGFVGPRAIVKFTVLVHPGCRVDSPWSRSRRRRL